MKVFCHNFNPDSDSGPNKFTRQLFSHLEKLGVEVESNQSKCDVEFALIHFEREKIRPTVLRLDGIYFNSDQNYHQQNLPIKYSYETADHIVFQSNFNKALTESWFGPHKNTSVIHNAADTNFIDKVSTKKLDEAFDMSTEIWSCASSWRPHKRLRENLDYFYKKAPSTAVMIVAGSNATVEDLKKYNELTNGRVYYFGNLNYYDLISLYKRSSTFVHLAYLDHCPNVVVDAQAAGCHVICSSSGGTSEIVHDGIIIQEEKWDFSPIKLYEPPKIDFDDYLIKKSESLNSIENTAQLYFNTMQKLREVN